MSIARVLQALSHPVLCAPLFPGRGLHLDCETTLQASPSSSIPGLDTINKVQVFCIVAPRIPERTVQLARRLHCAQLRASAYASFDVSLNITDTLTSSLQSSADVIRPVKQSLDHAKDSSASCHGPLSSLKSASVEMDEFQDSTVCKQDCKAHRVCATLVISLLERPQIVQDFYHMSHLLQQASLLGSLRAVPPCPAGRLLS